MTPDIVALAAETGVDAVTGMPEAITTGVTNAVSLVGTAFTAISGNTVLCILLGAALVRVGLSIFRSMKSSVR